MFCFYFLGKQKKHFWNLKRFYILICNLYSYIKANSSSNNNNIFILFLNLYRLIILNIINIQLFNLNISKESFYYAGIFPRNTFCYQRHLWCVVLQLFYVHSVLPCIYFKELSFNQTTLKSLITVHFNRIYVRLNQK